MAGEPNGPVESGGTWFCGDAGSGSVQASNRTFSPTLHLCPHLIRRCVLKVILRDVDSLLYVDTDVLFLRPMDDIWSLFKSFNATQLAAMAPEHEVPKIGWYSRFARHPFYGVTGVNSGVMLMNLTRIRSAAFKVRSKTRLRPPRLKCCFLFWSAAAACSDYHARLSHRRPHNSIYPPPSPG